jgi:hypothetical protein
LLLPTLEFELCCARHELSLSDDGLLLDGYIAPSASSGSLDNASMSTAGNARDSNASGSLCFVLSRDRSCSVQYRNPYLQVIYQLEQALLKFCPRLGCLVRFNFPTLPQTVRAFPLVCCDLDLDSHHSGAFNAAAEQALSLFSATNALDTKFSATAMPSSTTLASTAFAAVPSSDSSTGAFRLCDLRADNAL